MLRKILVGLAGLALLAAGSGTAIARPESQNGLTGPGQSNAQLAVAHVASAAPPQYVPPECTHKTRLDNSPISRAWVFVMNFRVAHTGCLIVYDRTHPNRLIRYKSLPDVCQTHGDVSYSNGRARFRDGYIACNVHIMNAVNEVAPPSAQITDTAVITAFYVLARGLLSPTLTITPDQESILTAYKPDNSNLATVSLGVVITSTNPAQAKLVARFNGNRHTSDNCGFGFDPDTNYLFAYTRPDNGIRMWLADPSGRTELCRNEPLPYIKFHQDGGTFYIGGVPDGLRFVGELEEVLFDPFDGTGPNSVQGDEDVEYSFAFLPLAIK